MLEIKSRFFAVCFIGVKILERKCKYANLHEAYKALVRVPLLVSNLNSNDAISKTMSLSILPLTPY